LNLQPIDYKSIALPLCYIGNLHIILPSPTPVNIFSGTLTLGTIVHERISVFPVTRSHLPLGLDLDFDLTVLPARPHIVVVLERNHTIVHFRVSRKPYPS
jgi:hypothetical protein